MKDVIHVTWTEQFTDSYDSFVLTIYNLNYGNVPQDVPQDVPQEKTLDIWIEGKIRENPKITTEDLAKLSGYTSKTIKRHIIKLTHIKYVGSGYSGHWEIVENDVGA